MQQERVLVPSTEGFSVPVDVYVAEVTEEIDAAIRRPAVVICPGGGYEFCSRREAEPVALSFVTKGFNAFVVWYRVAPHRYPCPQQDAAAAMAWVRAHAAETHTDPARVAIMGFSAGGHLAGSIGVMWRRPELLEPLSLTPAQVRPDAMVLCYPVITGGPKAHRGSFAALTGTDDLAVHEQFSLETLVDAQTPPTFLWHTWDDGCVPVENSLLMAQALKHSGVQAALHIFPHGGHGSSLCNNETSGSRNPRLVMPEVALWAEMAASFLQKEM